MSSSGCGKMSKWNGQSDQLLAKLREVDLIEDWGQISKKVTESFPNFYRSGKQCRQRYTNFVKFKEGSREWSQNEILTLKQQFLLIGPKWSDISKCFRLKTQNSLKNKFNSELRKTLRRINSYRMTTKNRNRKPIESDWFNKLSRTVFGDEVIDLTHQREAESLLHDFVNAIFDGESNQKDESNKQLLGSLLVKISKYNRNYLFLKKKGQNLEDFSIVREKIEEEDANVQKERPFVAHSTEQYHSPQSQLDKLNSEGKIEEKQNPESVQLQDSRQLRQLSFQIEAQEQQEIPMMNFQPRNPKLSFDYFDISV